jgi:hypothetical protein
MDSIVISYLRVVVPSYNIKSSYLSYKKGVYSTLL